MKICDIKPGMLIYDEYQCKFKLVISFCGSFDHACNIPCNIMKFIVSGNSWKHKFDVQNNNIIQSHTFYDRRINDNIDSWDLHIVSKLQ